MGLYFKIARLPMYLQPTFFSLSIKFFNYVVILEKIMKTIILISMMLFTSVTLSAKDFHKEFMSLSFTNVEIFNKEIVPSLGVEISPEILDRFDFMIAYANNLFTENKLEILQNRQNPKMQNIYITLNYKF